MRNKRHLPDDVVVNWKNITFEGEARIEGAKRPRIEGKARTEVEGRGRISRNGARTEGTEGEARVKAPLRGLPGRQCHQGNAGFPS